MGQIIRATVTFTIDVDADRWTEAYGTDPDDVKGDVETYFDRTAPSDVWNAAREWQRDDSGPRYATVQVRELNGR